jgi:hypothetical protein
MPRILEMRVIDGKLAVFLDMPTEDEGSVSLWTDGEHEAALRAEREACASLADELGAKRRAMEAERGFGPATATPVANQFWCEEIGEAIRARK